MTAPRRVIGLGNPDRGDDAVGLHVARRVAARGLDGVEVREATGDALALLEDFASAAHLILVDAAAALAAPGRIHRLDPLSRPLPREIVPASTHAFGLAEAIELARTLGQLPQHFTVYAIEAAAFGAGAPLSAPVAAAVERVAKRIVAELGGGA